jgi:hypothetical protein
LSFMAEDWKEQWRLCYLASRVVTPDEVASSLVAETHTFGAKPRDLSLQAAAGEDDQHRRRYNANMG